MDGTVEIDFHLANAQRCIVLSAAGLDITSIRLSTQQQMPGMAAPHASLGGLSRLYGSLSLQHLLAGITKVLKVCGLMDLPSQSSSVRLMACA